ncbi:tripartite tricarboxylate transporter substrate binding protein [Rhodovarius crocodyli]|uniref:Tripartite tricarboxylate transporter substrate binding protein n=1 Tax=Rhodovarius crocodyli TaxID=1979269 RepID=A0A437MNY0_9PROT|nr:tripartite tricarboxylate transporter substrate binding protein [Rhodovarius crocodyli]RVT99343.1 tripartite tricarboxylate transporter substrate binding protein [Rhodovarius crocodyli]
MFTLTRRALGASALLATPALAQSGFPARNVTIVVPFAPGGSTDVVSRLMAERMTQTLGRPVQVENRPGANTVIGAEYVARAQPDGYTLLMSSGTTLTINPIIQRNLPYRIEDFSPISLATTYPFAVIARPDGPRSVQELIDRAKARPGTITYGHNGPTTLTNVAMLMVLEKLGLRMQDVTYRGDAAAMNDFVAGNLDLLVVAGSTAVPVQRNGQGRILGWTSARRMPQTPDVPAFAEFAPGLEALSWFGLLAPARTPQNAIDTLHNAAKEALTDARLKERLDAEAQTIIGSTPAEFAQFLSQQQELWRPTLARMEVPLN